VVRLRTVSARQAPFRRVERQAALTSLRAPTTHRVERQPTRHVRLVRIPLGERPFAPSVWRVSTTDQVEATTPVCARTAWQAPMLPHLEPLRAPLCLLEATPIWEWPRQVPFCVRLDTSRSEERVSPPARPVLWELSSGPLVERLRTFV
jgi:hypothetical protein